MFFRTLHTRKPTHPVRNKKLVLWLQQGVVQVEVVDTAYPQEVLAGKAAANSVHQATADGAEVIRHGVAGLDALVGRPCRELVLSTDVLHVLVVDAEVGGEHGCGDFAAVATVADERELDFVNCLRIKKRQCRCLQGVDFSSIESLLTNSSCTAPQKQVAVALLSLLQPSPPNGMLGSEEGMMAVMPRLDAYSVREWFVLDMAN